MLWAFMSCLLTSLREMTRLKVVFPNSMVKAGLCKAARWKHCRKWGRLKRSKRDDHKGPNPHALNMME